MRPPDSGWLRWCLKFDPWITGRREARSPRRLVWWDDPTSPQPTADLNYHSFQSESDRYELFVQITSAASFRSEA